MCGRYALYADTPRIAAFTDLVGRLQGDFLPRYNITPGTPIITIQERLGSRSIETYTWGFTPHQHTGTKKIQPINARAETIAHNMFGDALRQHRCLFPCNGFYEPDKSSQPSRQYYFHREDDGLLAMAGIYTTTPTENGRNITCAIITVPANATVQAINHDRMPALLPKKHFDAWLDPSYRNPDITGLLRTAPNDLLISHEVDASLLNRRQGRVVIDTSDNIAPIRQ